MSGKENLQLFLSPRVSARSAAAHKGEDKLGELQVFCAQKTFPHLILRLNNYFSSSSGRTAQ
jgi:hypothetical protein